MLSTFAGSTGAADGRPRAGALLSTSIDNTQLTADADTTVSIGKDTPVIKVEVQNQGDQEEKEVAVSYSLSGGAVPLEGEGTIARLDASGIDDVTIPLDDAPRPDVPLTLEVEVLPVPGEEVADEQRRHLHGHVQLSRRAQASAWL